jgi:hypothetical protein
MPASIKQMNRFVKFKLTLAYLCGLRLTKLSDSVAVISVRLNWLNKNPFRSMYFAVQSMAAELSTGVMLLDKINDSGKKVSMLVTGYSAEFRKKAVGRITFICNDGLLIEQALKNTIATGDPQIIEMKSVGIDEMGDQVSNYAFQWSIRLKK